MNLRRIFKHLLMPSWRVRHVLPLHSQRAIEAAIKQNEETHTGEIRFAVEATLHPLSLWHGQTARFRALELFSLLRLWDTTGNNGVLIYLLLADCDVEIIVDRGIQAHVQQPEWERICKDMEAEFSKDNFENGVITGINAVGQLLARYFPPQEKSDNELSDRLFQL